MKSAFTALCAGAVLLAAAAAGAQGLPGWKGYPAGYVFPVGDGPYPAVMETEPSLATHTVYHPKALDRFGAAEKLPIVAFGNGGCANVGSMYRDFLTEIASQGMLVIAVGPVGADLRALPAPNMPPPQPGAPPPKLPPVATQSSQLIDAINWAVAENGRAGGKYHGKLDTKAIAVMGQSCGGVQALEVSTDPRVKTTVVLNSGLFSEKSPIPGLDVPESHLARLHAPVAYFIGGSKDVAFPNAEHNYPLLKVPVFKANMEVGHMATYAQPNGGAFGKVAADWLRWRLKGDRAAGARFTGSGCGLCKDPAWKVERKGIG